MYVLGLMSGTSADGVDAALVNFRGNSSKPKWHPINTFSLKYPSYLQKRIVSAGQGLTLNSSEWLELSETITKYHFFAAKECDPDGIAQLIGCHGQTVFHRPPNDLNKGASWQIIQAPLLAISINKPVIFDFRSKDLSLGGQGAPLSPFLDQALIGSDFGWTAILNLGGISNLSMVPPRSGPDRNLGLFGWDCGPANSLIDLAIQKISNGKFAYDLDGSIASKGTSDLNVIKKWLQEDFFQLPPPKSTGREMFGTKDLDIRLSEINSNNQNDLIATLTSFSACIVAQDLEKFYIRKSIKPSKLLVGGGGSRNSFLLQEIKNRCAGIRVLTTDEFGIPYQAREAMAFALLAWWNFHSKPCPNGMTGSARSSVLGSVVNPF